MNILSCTLRLSVAATHFSSQLSDESKRRGLVTQSLTGDADAAHPAARRAKRSDIARLGKSRREDFDFD